MDIKNIEETACPECGCRHIIEESVSAQHCNGHYNEYRKFDCGMKLHFSPNFMRTDPSPHERCTQSGAFVEQRKIRVKAVDDLKAYICNMKTDEKFIEMLMDKFGYIRYDL